MVRERAGRWEDGMTHLPRVNTALVGHADGPDGQGEYTFEKKKAPAKAKAA